MNVDRTMFHLRSTYYDGVRSCAPRSRQVATGCRPSIEKKSRK